ADEGVPRTGVPGAVGSAGARLVGASASTISTSPTRHRPAHPAGPRRARTTALGGTVAAAGSVRVTVVAVLARTVVSPMPNSTYPRNIGTSAMYPATTRFWADATRGAPVSSSTGSRSAPPAPNTEPIAAGRAIPAVRRRCTDHGKVAERAPATRPSPMPCAVGAAAAGRAPSVEAHSARLPAMPRPAASIHHRLSGALSIHRSSRPEASGAEASEIAEPTATPAR